MSGSHQTYCTVIYSEWKAAACIKGNNFVLFGDYMHSAMSRVIGS